MQELSILYIDYFQPRQALSLPPYISHKITSLLRGLLVTQIDWAVYTVPTFAFTYLFFLFLKNIS